MPEIKLKKEFKDAIIPTYATEGSAGCDLYVHNFKLYYETGNSSPEKFVPASQVEKISMYPDSRLLVGTGISLAIPRGFMMEIRPRSGNAIKQGLTVLNSPGTIDSDYRGEIGIVLYNSSKDIVIINRGDKIAQGVIVKHKVALFIEVEELDNTLRGRGGFGSTNKEKFDIDKELKIREQFK